MWSVTNKINEQKQTHRYSEQTGLPDKEGQGMGRKGEGSKKLQNSQKMQSTPLVIQAIMM